MRRILAARMNLVRILAACLPVAPGAWPRTRSTCAPVLIMAGAQDAVFCAASPAIDCADPAQIAEPESPYYASAASLTACSIADTGHDIALHPPAALSFSFINGWLSRARGRARLSRSTRTRNSADR